VVADAGLCASCRFSRTVVAKRRASYTRCARSDDDARYARYPKLPVLACSGYEPRLLESRHRGEEPPMLSVTSEVGRLRKVLVHEPGPEVDNMVPSMMEELLFDDILYGDRAREEHARLRRTLQVLGIETVDAQDLLEEVLRNPVARAWTLDATLPPEATALRARFDDAPAEHLAESLVGGSRLTRGPAAALDVTDLFEVPPLPNWCFQRDPQIVIGPGVMFASMASAAREREAFLARAVFRYHPDLSAAPVWEDPGDLAFEHSHVAGAGRARLEGGDVIVVSPDVIAVGLSERTNRLGIEHLARALAARDDGPRFLVVVELPRRRAYMHLDTLFTPIDRDLALVYPPVILQDGAERANVFEIDLRSDLRAWSARKDLLTCLARRGTGFDPIACGGDDPIAQQREQWTDGANALALAPGVIAMYDRNSETIETLARRSFRVVTAKDLLLGREEIDLDEPEKVCIAFASHELSRARGGPHCLTHPLRRDP